MIQKVVLSEPWTPWLRCSLMILGDYWLTGLTCFAWKMMKIGRPQLEFCRVQQIPTDVDQHKKGPREDRKRNPYYFVGDLLLIWAPHKPKIKIDQKALMTLISTMPCFCEMNMILPAILMLKYQDFDLCRHLTGSSLRRRNSSATWRAKVHGPACCFFLNMVVEFEFGEWR